MNEYLSGFVSIVGSPNVGKSTLMNAFVGQKVAIVSKKAQTTRNTIRGVMTRKGYQVIFIDTPGIHTPKNKLGEYMVKVAYDALSEVECVLFIVDATVGIKERDQSIFKRLERVRSPVYCVINKIDIAREGQLESIRETASKAEGLAGIIEVSAATGQGLDELEKRIFMHLTPGPQYFPDDMITDQPERVLCAEMVREAALELLQEEIPHGLGVDIEKMAVREDQQMTDIYVTIYCERESHKSIIIGKRGSMLKNIGIKARREIEWMLGSRVNLQLWVKVREDWRNKRSDMNMLGYSADR